MASVHVQPGRIVQAVLHGQELAVWRNAQGTVQAWENRCPHRGMRLTMGRIVDDQLACAYHGWRFGSGGQCTAIPAHPGMTPPRTVCAKTYPVTERCGMVWIAMDQPDEDAPAIPPLADPQRRALFCRSFVTYASIQSVSEVLQRDSSTVYSKHGDSVLIDGSDPDVLAILLLHPMTAAKSVVHLWLSLASDAGDDETLIAKQIAQFKRQRRGIEALLAA